MQRAVIDDDEVVRGAEKCHCPTPLEYERSTVNDRFFIEIETEETDDYLEIEGETLKEFLEQAALGGE